MRAIHRTCCVGLGFFVLVAGCGPDEPPVELAPVPPDYPRELAPGEKALVKLTDPSQFPDFSMGFEQQTGLEQAAMFSLEYLSKPSSETFFPYLDISHERAVASVEAFIDVIRSVRSGAELDRTIKERFDIYTSRGWDELGTVLFTGYYRPIFDARLKPDAEFRYPLHKRPPDLERSDATGDYQRKGGGRYDTRSEIARGALAGRGLELCYLRDPFEAYIVTVQGSGRLRLADGRLFDIGYHGDNGYEYTSIGQRLVNEGRISAADLSLQGLIRYFQEHPGEHESALGVNDRYVFFTPRSGGPYGSLNVPVTPFRTIATDNDVFPRAGVAFLSTNVPGRSADGSIRQYAYEGFAMDQDTGGAIRAAGRCDFFLGTGPEVGELAGRTFAEGRLYYVFVKTDDPHAAALAGPQPPQGPESPEPGPVYGPEDFTPEP